MYNGANEDILRYGSVDNNEYLKAKYEMKSHIESLEGVIKLLSAQIVQRDDLLKRVYERIDSETLRKEVDNIIPKWYDNIPEHGVLCWVGEHLPLTKNANSLRTIVEYDSDRGCGFIMYRTEAIIASWTHAVPLTNEEIEEFKR